MKLIMLGAPGAGKEPTGKENLCKVQNSAHFHWRHFPDKYQKRHRTGHEGQSIYGSGTVGAG